VVTAYTALRLVEEGNLSIDEPVHSYLDNPWLPPSVFADRITLRQLLSHSSGLGDGTWFKNKSIVFEPGTNFLYSGLGFEYVRELIEQLSGTSFEQVAREKVFEPLSMSSSSFVDETSVMNYMSNGQMSYLLIFLFFLIPFLSIMVIIGVITLILNRFIKRRWKVAWQLKISVPVSNGAVSTIIPILIPCLIPVSAKVGFEKFIFIPVYALQHAGVRINDKSTQNLFFSCV